MSKVKLIIDIDESDFYAIKTNQYYGKELEKIIANGTPYNTSGDLISREALKESISTYDKFACLPDTRLVPFYELPYAEEDYVPYVRLADIVKAINNAPTVDKRPQNKWIKIFENPFTNGYVCSFCGHKIQVTEKFLPQVTECEACGADMRGNADE